MKKKFVFIIFLISLLFLIVVAFIFEKDDVRAIYIPGFEAEDAEIDRKYGEKKIFSPEELEAMGNEIRDLQERKIKAYIESQSSSSGGVINN